MKTLLTLSTALILATLAPTALNAASLTVVFDQPNQSALPGVTIDYFGTITNTGTSTIYLNSDDVNPHSASITVTDQFFTTVLPSLDPGQSTGDIELFDLTLSNPLVDLAGLDLGEYTLIGGQDGNAQDNLVTANFSVNTAASLASSVPEPASVSLLLSAMVGAPVLLSKTRRTARRG